ncbi:DUF4112 domain-containing protein [Citromicrobium bathyomarinum]|uniref:DUF4112 domain-containing protein n=1 Tax=Citromicrobium bathyomarinum TaxID=72174 RepID=UPI003159F948
MGDTRTMNLLGVEVPAGNDPASVYRRIQMMEQLMERSMTIPGINYPVGMDAIVGLIPVLGDIFGVAMGTYIVWEARNLGMPKWHMSRMIGNVAIDGVIGFVPLAGDMADFAFRSNTRNLKIVKKYMCKHHPDVSIVDC